MNSKIASLAFFVALQTVFFCAISQPVTTHRTKQGSMRMTNLALDSMLTLYSKEVNDPVIAVTIEHYDSSYNFTLSSVGTYNEATRYPITTYRRWQDRILLIYTGLENVLSVDSTQSKRFFKEMRALLPSSYTEKKIREGLYESTILVTHPVIWNFRMQRNKIDELRKIKTG